MQKTNNSLNDSKPINRRLELFAVKKLSALLRGITLLEFYCLICLHCFRKENKLKFHENVFKNKDICGIVMPSEKDNILEFNRYMKLDKISYTIHADNL